MFTCCSLTAIRGKIPLSDIGQDNEPFLQDLERLGFTINRAATTRFARTELTLSSLVVSDASNLGAYVYGRDHGTTELRRAVRRQQLVNSPVMDDLRALGYRMVYVPPPVTFAHWQGWDDIEEPGPANGLRSCHHPAVSPSVSPGWMGPRTSQAADRRYARDVVSGAPANGSPLLTSWHLIHRSSGTMMAQLRRPFLVGMPWLARCSTDFPATSASARLSSWTRSGPRSPH